MAETGVTVRNYKHIEVRPIAGALGAEIGGVDMATDLGAEMVVEVRQALLDHLVIFLREHLFDFELRHYRPLGDPTRFLDALASLFSRCKDEDVPPEAFLAHAERLRAQKSQAAQKAA